MGIQAQSVGPKPKGPNTMWGIVSDQAGRPLEEAEVSVRNPRLRVLTRTDGSFLFEKIKPGRYEILVRRVGFRSMSVGVTVADSGGSVYVRMERAAITLPSVITTADRDGLSGVIGDTSYRAMPSVHVRVLGTDRRTVTNQSGAFYLDLKPGRHMVELTHDGFARQLVGVTIPDKGGRKLAAWMLPRTGPDNPQEDANIMELTQRVIRASPVWTKLYTREDLEKLGQRDLHQVAILGANKGLAHTCPVLIDGGPRSTGLWQIDARDVEFLEVYTPRPPRSRTTSLSGASNAGRASGMDIVPSSSCGVTVIAWLRK